MASLHRHYRDFPVTEHGRFRVERVQHELPVDAVKVLVGTGRQGDDGSPDVLFAFDQRERVRVPFIEISGEFDRGGVGYPDGEFCEAYFRLGGCPPADRPAWDA